MTYLTAFPDYDADLPQLRGYHDDSWADDVCPSLSCVLEYHTIHGNTDGATIKIWCDYADPALRELGGARYTVTVSLDDDAPQTIAASDDWQTILTALRALRWLA